MMEDFVSLGGEILEGFVNLGGEMVLSRFWASPDETKPSCITKAEQIQQVLSEPEVNLWKLRELAISEGGLINDTLRRTAWPKLLGIAYRVEPPAAIPATEGNIQVPITPTNTIITPSSAGQVLEPLSTPPMALSSLPRDDLEALSPVTPSVSSPPAIKTNTPLVTTVDEDSDTMEPAPPTPTASNKSPTGASSLLSPNKFLRDSLQRLPSVREVPSNGEALGPSSSSDSSPSAKGPSSPGEAGEQLLAPSSSSLDQSVPASKPESERRWEGNPDWNVSCSSIKSTTSKAESGRRWEGNPDWNVSCSSIKTTTSKPESGRRWESNPEWNVSCSSIMTTASKPASGDELSISSNTTASVSNHPRKRKPVHILAQSLDAKQIDLDVHRCTWHLLKGDAKIRRLQMENRGHRKIKRYIRRKQRRLANLLNYSIISSYPVTGPTDRLRYYQGYHDVACIFLATLGGPNELSGSSLPQNRRPSLLLPLRNHNIPPSIQILAASMGLDLPAQSMMQLSLTHLRDCLKQDFSQLQTAIQLTIFPLIALLDPHVYEHLMDAGMQPFFALSWVITWFAHEIRDTEVVKRLFDFFLVSHPLMPIYMSVAMVLHPNNREDVLSTECDFAALHQTLRHLPKNSSMVGWKYKPGDGYVSDDEEGDDEDGAEESLEACVGDIAKIRAELGKTTANRPIQTSSIPRSTSSQSLDDQDASVSTATESLLELQTRVTFEDLIDLAMEYINAVPPHELLPLAVRLYGKDHVTKLLSMAPGITLFAEPPEWAKRERTTADWVIKQRERSAAKHPSSRPPEGPPPDHPLHGKGIEIMLDSKGGDFISRNRSKRSVIALGYGDGSQANKRRRKRRQRMLCRVLGVATIVIVAMTAGWALHWYTTSRSSISDSGSPELQGGGWFDYVSTGERKRKRKRRRETSFELPKAKPDDLPKASTSQENTTMPNPDFNFTSTSAGETLSNTSATSYETSVHGETPTGSLVPSWHPVPTNANPNTANRVTKTYLVRHHRSRISLECREWRDPADRSDNLSYCCKTKGSDTPLKEACGSNKPSLGFVFYMDGGKSGSLPMGFVKEAVLSEDVITAEAEPAPSPFENPTAPTFGAIERSTMASRANRRDFKSKRLPVWRKVLSQLGALSIAHKSLSNFSPDIEDELGEDVVRMVSKSARVVGRKLMQAKSSARRMLAKRAVRTREKVVGIAKGVASVPSRVATVVLDHPVSKVVSVVAEKAVDFFDKPFGEGMAVIVEVLNRRVEF